MHYSCTLINRITETSYRCDLYLPQQIQCSRPCLTSKPWERCLSSSRNRTPGTPVWIDYSSQAQQHKTGSWPSSGAHRWLPSNTGSIRANVWLRAATEVWEINIVNTVSHHPVGGNEWATCMCISCFMMIHAHSGNLISSMWILKVCTWHSGFTAILLIYEEQVFKGYCCKGCFDRIHALVCTETDSFIVLIATRICKLACTRVPITNFI